MWQVAGQHESTSSGRSLPSVEPELDPAAGLRLEHLNILLSLLPRLYITVITNILPLL